MQNNPYGISVLFSVYHKEKPQYLKQAIESMIHQTRQPDEIVIVEDGKLTDELYQELVLLEQNYPNLIKRYPLAENVGLGLALKYGVEQCSYSLIARMDTDDISIPDRLALQEQAFLSDEKLDIIGGHISEFIDDPMLPVSYRCVPLNDKEIKLYQKRRSAFNHMCVMFKKETVLRAGNYEHGLYMEDDLLWLNMISAGAKMQNLDKVLCYVRVGDGMYERRGGLNYLKKYQQARKLMLERKQISPVDYWYSVFVQWIVAVMPASVRKFVFVKLLRG